MKSFFPTRSLRQHRKSERRGGLYPLLQTNDFIRLKLKELSPVENDVNHRELYRLRG
ncbi:hypothetical protein BN77_p30040 [Rhizobium mesoamericanum STM3625]|uniref:Uncharacterized protein n=1 Tax=Rhizobium mesoamericanum STM3625 TaxID=1211777 RepID=K0PSC2_9HYPH|nr:hypothetical protein BN77_p30040 [Rhizobium mesoamericanum STM3625]